MQSRFTHVSFCGIPFLFSYLNMAIKKGNRIAQLPGNGVCQPFWSINFGTCRTESFISLPHNGHAGCSRNDKSCRIHPLHESPVHVHTSASISLTSS
jgi:hypothetical protein